ncbi:phosphonoacetaldehyde hydrolase [Paenibacillus ferrarius]|uniref:phosphonoacetaldehyde hydrolase n=1 Tax=Paenibacillus ferrarius TaxID=1469647 RepID=UPI0009A4F40E|nr:phosphonoacetaldehyde hydrolase [Paenibacillus ferrarius]
MTKKVENQIQAVIFDWAGTMVDYGCFAPLDVFLRIFEKRGIAITAEEARGPMGLLKWDHIQTLCAIPRIAQLWKDKFGVLPTDADVDDLYADFEPMLFDILPRYTDLIPGALDLVKELRARGLKIGSTTGYTAEMMNIVSREAKRKGYEPDSLVTPSEVRAGRPYPWMCYINAMNLGVYPFKAIIKVGDTISDIQEGVNAGAWSVGVVKGGSELGLTEEEVNTMPAEELKAQIAVVEKRFFQAGAHYVIPTIGDLVHVIDDINERMAGGDE